MKSNDYVKFMTEQFVMYMNKPKSERRKDRTRKERSVYSSNWFGLFPFTIKFLLKK